MVRNLIAVLAAAVFLVSCGSQPVPPRMQLSATALRPGQMQIKVTAQGPIDFVHNWYVFPFDLTCSGGGNCVPYAINGTPNNDWLNWDFELVVGQPTGSNIVQSALFQFLSPLNNTTKVPVMVTNYAPNDLTVTGCGNPNQFCVTFYRRIFNGIEPGPSPPLSGPGGTWYVNFLVATPQPSFNQNNPVGQPIFAPGAFGLNDQTFTFPLTAGLDVAMNFQLFMNAQPTPPWMQAPDPAAQLTQFEVSNKP